MNITVKLPSGEEKSVHFDGPTVVIGRGNQADFVVKDKSLSRLHCRVDFENGEFFLTDLESSNGVFINGSRIPVNQKTPYSTFLSLMIARVECQICDELPEEVPPAPESSGIGADYTTVTNSSKQLNRGTRPGAEQISPPSKKQMFQLTPLLLGVIGIMVLGLIYIFTPNNRPAPNIPTVSTPEPPNLAIPVPATAPESEKVLIDEFLDRTGYESLRAKKSCKIHFELCHDMHLTENEEEGVLIEGKEVFLYLTPTRNLGQFSELKSKADALDVLAIKSFLDSSLYSEFKNKLIEQVHLVVQDEEFHTYKIYRFNSNNYIHDEGTETALQTAILSGNTTPFWDLMRSRVKSKTF